MKLKYYLRGLGIGIIVTAVIMGVTSGHRKETLSDREIRERAAALGMVEQGNLLADMETPSESAPKEEGASQAEETPEAVPSAPEEEQETAKPEETPAEEPVQEPVQTPEKMQPEEPMQEPDEEEAKPAGTEEASPENLPTGAVTIEILSGEGSYAVCRKLEEAGLIASASDFDVYLYTNGYDRKLRTGSYQVPAGAEPATIAAILTQMQ